MALFTTSSIYNGLAWRGLDQVDVIAWNNLLPATQVSIGNLIDNYVSANSNQSCQ